MKNPIYASLVVGLLAPAAALPADDPPATDPGGLTLAQLRTFADVFNQVRRNYVDEIEESKLLDAAIRGMLAELDDHSELLEPDDFRAIDDTSRGRYGGIGVAVDVRDGRIAVTRVTPGGPADQAGIAPGDLVTAVDGRPVRGRKLSEAIAQLRGEPGTVVALRVQSEGSESRSVELTRAYIPVPSVDFRLLDGRFGYFHISHFHEETHADLADAINRVAGAAERRLQGVILDLRGNQGGVLRPAVAIADGFLESGLIVNTRSRYADTQMAFRANPGEWLPGIPLAVLVNGGTASASEVLTGALQDHGRAVVIGERTFGKGSIQSVLSLRDGSGLRLTTARYFTPSGKSIQGQGIAPDIVVQESQGSDRALEQAVEFLSERQGG